MNEMNDQNLYLEPKRRITWQWWFVIGFVGLLLGVGILAVALGARRFVSGTPAATAPVVTLVPTFTPRPAATPTPPVVTLSVRSWTNDRAPVGMVEVTLSLPAAARVSHQPPPGYRYWRGNLVQTRRGLAWTGSGPGQVRWYLLREPGAVFPTTLEVTVSDQRKGSGTPQTLAINLQPATPATVSAVLDASERRP